MSTGGVDCGTLGGFGGLILYQVAGHLSEASTQHNVINPCRKNPTDINHAYIQCVLIKL